MSTKITMQEIIRDLRYSLPVAELGLSVRAKNALEGNGIGFVGQLVEKNEAKLRRIPNFGSLCFSQVKGALESRGLELDTEILDRPNDSNVFLQVFNKNREAALVQDKHRAAGVVAGVSPDSQVFMIVAEMLVANRRQAFQQAAGLLLEASSKIKPPSNVRLDALPASLPAAVKIFDESESAAFEDAAMVVRKLSERLTDPVFQEMLTESFRRYDQQRVASPGGRELG